jgi:hypothetical protein
MILPAPESEAQGFAIVRNFTDLGGGFAEEFHERGWGGKTIKGVLPHAAVVHQAGLLELRQVCGNVTLAAAQNLLEFGDGKLFLLEQQEKAEAVGIGREAQRFEN